MMKRLTLWVVALIFVGCSMRDNPVTGKGNVDVDEMYDSTIVYDTAIVVDTSDNGEITIDTVITDSIIIDTTSGNNDQGVVIVSERTESIYLTGGGANVTTVVGTDTVALSDIRNEIEKENMSLPLFAVTNLRINGTNENSAVALSLINVPVVLKVFTIIPGDSAEPAINSPRVGSAKTVKTFGELHNGLTLNDGLYESESGALKSFEDKVKNESMDEIIFQVEVSFLEPVTISDNYELEFTIEGSSKKKL